MIAGSCDMFSFPYPSMLVGAFAGIVCVLSYNFLSKIQLKWNLFDTRGILHLHLIPGFFGGIAGAIAISTLSLGYFGSGKDIE